jgi:hypothetical protein
VNSVLNATQPSPDDRSGNLRRHRRAGFCLQVPSEPDVSEKPFVYTLRIQKWGYQRTGRREEQVLEVSAVASRRLVFSPEDWGYMRLFPTRNELQPAEPKFKPSAVSLLWTFAWTLPFVCWTPSPTNSTHKPSPLCRTIQAYIQGTENGPHILVQMTACWFVAHCM